MGLLDAFSADPGSAQAMQLQGLLGGLTRMGGLLAQAGQFRPVGQAAPGIGDAFLGFGEGQKAATANAYQNAQMARKAAQQALIAEAQSQKPDADLSPQAAAMRRALSGMPEDVRALAGPDELPGLAIDRAKSRMTPIDAARAAALGLRPGTVAMESAWTGAPSVLQQSDVKSPEAMAQRMREIAASHAPQTRWTTIMGDDGKPMAQVSSLGEYRPLRPDTPLVKIGPEDRLFDPRTKQVVAEGGPRRPNLPPGYEMVDGKAVMVPGLAEAQAPGKAQTVGNDLRGEFTKLTGDFRTVQDAYQKIEMAGKTGQGDMALLYGYMKILDPGSVVRESEFATAARSGSLPQQVQGWATRIVNGEKLPDTVREGFKTEARNVYQAQAKSYMNTHNIYRDLALRQGVKPEDVVLPFKMDGTGGGGGGSGPGGGARDPLGILK